MRKILTFSVVFSILGIGAIIVNGSPNSPTLGGRVVLISEEDGDPVSLLRILRVPNDSLTNNGGGDISLDTSVGDADEVAVAASTTALQALIDLNITALAQVGIDTVTLQGLIDSNIAVLVTVGIDTDTLKTEIDDKASINGPYASETDQDTGLFINRSGGSGNFEILSNNIQHIIGNSSGLTFTQKIKLPNGNPTTPSLRNANDLDTGIFFSTFEIEKIGLVIDANTKLSITASGKVGISTRNPQATLHVAGTGVADLLIESNTGDEGHLRLKRLDDEWGIHILADSDLIIHSEKTGVSAIHFKDTGEVNIGSDTFKSTFTASGNLNIPGTITATGLDCTDCVNTADIADATVTSDKIADGSITTAKFADVCAANEVIARNAGDTAWECSSTVGVALGDSPTWTGNHTWDNPLLAAEGTQQFPSITFAGNTDTGLFSVAGQMRLTVNGSGKLAITPQGVQLLTADSASAPSLHFNELGTGFFRPAANILGFTTSGIEKMRIDASGNVGIGETDPEARLEVKAALADLFTVQISSQDGSAVMVVDRLGRVGVGTDSPLSTLDVAGNFAVSGASVYQGSMTISGVDLLVRGSVIVELAGTPGPKIVTKMASNSLGTFRAEGTANDTLQVGGAFKLSLATFDGSWMDRLIFETAGAATFLSSVSLPTTDLFVGGNVGIGTASPGAKLEVKALVGNQFIVQISSQGGSSVWNVDRLGLVEPPSFTIAELKLIAPRVLGQTAYCSDCTLAGGRMVESTGTSAGNWADADGSNWD